jgi:hypothetical protein
MNKKRMNRKPSGWLLLAAGLAIAAGCVERRLTIHTEPADAVVWLNDEEIGATPVTVGFNWYGDYKVRVEKEGYQILNTHRELPRPAEDYFPLDFFAEVLWPGTIKRDAAWTFTLVPAANPSRDELLEQAAQFKEQAEQELSTVRQEHGPATP